MPELGHRIREHRKSRGLKLSQLAAEAGISTSYLSQIERGEKDSVSADILFRVAKALGITAKALYQPPRKAERIEVSMDDIPEPLKDFYEKRGKSLGMTDVDLAMLSKIRYRNMQPRTQEDWEFLYLSIRRTIEP